MIYFDVKKRFEDKSKEEIIDDYIELLKEKHKLEKELKKYKNANTPSSKSRFNRPKAQGIPVGRKKGKKSGHKGKTRLADEPNEIIDVTVDVDPKLKNKKLQPTGYFVEIVITDFQIVKIVKQYNCYEYIDLDTGKIVIAKHPDMPSRGIFGKNVLTLTNYLRFNCRVPFSKIASLFTLALKIPMSPPTALDICTRVADKVSPHYNQLKKNIKSEKAVNADETSARKNGLPGWLWGFFSLTIALLIFNKKRGGDIVKRILGKDFKGILGCDGWSTYVKFSKDAKILLQRCWAHALREVKFLCVNPKKPDKSLQKAYEWLCDIFEKIQHARQYKNKEIREQLYVELVDELNNWIHVYKSYKKIREVVQKIENGAEFWFTCVLHLEIEPTNNRAERGLRPWVVLEKIIGCLRSNQGQRTTEIMLSLFNTWDLRKLNSYDQLRFLL